MLCIPICAVICGAQHGTQVEQFGLAKESWFRTFLILEKGIPSHDTFGDFFAALNPARFEECFIRWVGAIAQQSLGDLSRVRMENAAENFSVVRRMALNWLKQEKTVKIGASFAKAVNG